MDIVWLMKPLGQSGWAAEMGGHGGEVCVKLWLEATAEFCALGICWEEEGDASGVFSLEEMEQVVPWARLCAVIWPYYLKGRRGQSLIGFDRMVRAHFLEQ